LLACWIPPLTQFRLAHTTTDIKPANFVFDCDGPDKQLKLIDFGLAQCIEAGPGGEAGSPKYVAPEVLAPCEVSTYDERVDLWSLGVMSYSMLTGKLPFDGKDRSEIFAAIVKAEYDRELLLGSCSSEAADFVQSMLAKNPEDRMPLSEALDHPFLRSTARGQGSREVLLAGVAGASSLVQNSFSFSGSGSRSGLSGSGVVSREPSSGDILDDSHNLTNSSPAFSPVSIGAAKWPQQQDSGAASSFSNIEIAVASGRRSINGRGGGAGRGGGGGSLLLRTSASQAVQGDLGLRQRVVRAVQRGYRRFVRSLPAKDPTA
jgi:serine/threonine protein kinase